jgi:hypothetical protein
MIPQNPTKSTVLNYPVAMVRVDTNHRGKRVVGRLMGNYIPVRRQGIKAMGCRNSPLTIKPYPMKIQAEYR